MLNDGELAIELAATPFEEPASLGAILLVTVIDQSSTLPCIQAARRVL